MLIESFKLAALNNYFFPLTVTEVRVYHPHVFIEIHEPGSLNVQNSLIMTFNIQTCAQLLDGILFRKCFQLEAFELQGAGHVGKRPYRLFAL